MRLWRRHDPQRGTRAPAHHRRAPRDWEGKRKGETTTAKCTGGTPQSIVLPLLHLNRESSSAGTGNLETTWYALAPVACFAQL